MIKNLGLPTILPTVALLVFMMFILFTIVLPNEGSQPDEPTKKSTPATPEALIFHCTPTSTPAVYYCVQQ